MPTTLLATQVPTPMAVTQTYLLSLAGNPGNAPSASNLAQGDTAALLTKFNVNATRLDVGQTYGGAGFCILWGLAISAGAGLLCNVAIGQAQALGIVEVSLPASIAVPDNTARIWIWLKQDATLAFVATSTTPPTASSVLLGSVATSGGSIVSVDASGVVYAVSGNLWRQTADALSPGDSPPSGVRIQTATQGGTWLWDGSAHRQMVDGSKLVFAPTGAKFAGGHVQESTELHVLSASLALSLSSANVQRITSSALQKVLLPASPSFGMQFRIFNDNAAGGANILIRDNADATTLATLTPLTNSVVDVVNSSGTPVWPAGPATLSVVPTPI